MHLPAATLVLLLITAPGADLPPDVPVSAPEPARYASSLSYHQFSSCSRSWSDYNARSSMVLTLAEGGRVSACRGREVNRANPDGPSRMMEQQGFRGTWKPDGAYIDVQLALDDKACPYKKEGSQNKSRGCTIKYCEAHAELSPKGFRDQKP